MCLVLRISLIYILILQRLIIHYQSSFSCSCGIVAAVQGVCDHEMMSSWVIDAVAFVGIVTYTSLQSIPQLSGSQLHWYAQGGISLFCIHFWDARKVVNKIGVPQY